MLGYIRENVLVCFARDSFWINKGKSWFSPGFKGWNPAFFKDKLIGPLPMPPPGKKTQMKGFFDLDTIMALASWAKILMILLRGALRCRSWLRVVLSPLLAELVSAPWPRGLVPFPRKRLACRICMDTKNPAKSLMSSFAGYLMGLCSERIVKVVTFTHNF